MLALRSAAAGILRSPATSLCLARRATVTTVQQRAAELAAASAQATDKPSALYDFDKYIGLTGAEILHQILLEREVKQVFGYPGGAILPVFDAIHESKHFDFVLPRHEQFGGHMAEGYARVTGKPGVLIVTSGPGATNTVTPLQDALMDGTPLVVLAGQVPSTMVGTDAFQEADVVGITRSCTKWNVTVPSVRDLPRYLHQAFDIATSGRPGPVLVDLPKDVTAGVLTKAARALTLNQRRHQPHQAKVRASDADLDRCAELINKAKRPVLYVGQGVIQAEATEQLRDFAARANIPVTTTLQGMGAFDELDERSLCMLGMHGHVAANRAMQQADLVIALGARFDDRVTGKLPEFAPEARRAAAAGRGGFLHFEISRKNLDKLVPATIGVVGDLGVNLKELMKRDLKHQPRTEWFDSIKTWKERYPFTYGASGDAPDGLLKPQHVVKTLYDQVKERNKDVVITTGVGCHQMWAAQFYRWRTPRSMITSGGSGTMGYGLPAAIGAQLAAPDKIVVDIDGDASFLMSCTELATAAQYNIPVKILLLNNNFQGMVKQWQDLFYEERHSHTDMINPDFVKMAEAFGIRGLKASTSAELPAVMEEFINHKGPVLLEACVSKMEHVYPMVAAGCALDEMKLHPELRHLQDSEVEVDLAPPEEEWRNLEAPVDPNEGPPRA